MPTVRTAKHLLLESTTKSVESGTNDVICQFCTVKGMVVDSEVLKAQNCALSKFSLPVHCNDVATSTGFENCTLVSKTAKKNSINFFENANFFDLSVKYLSLGSKRNNYLCSTPFEGNFCIFSGRKGRNTPKNPKVFDVFMHYSQNFRAISWVIMA